MKPIVKTIDDPKAPARLRGLKVTILLDPVNRTLDFRADLPDDPTPNEIGYLKLTVGEYVDGLRKQFPFIGDARYEMKQEPEAPANGS